MLNSSAYLINHCWQFCVNFWVIFGHFGKEIFISVLKGKVKLRKIWTVEDLENWNSKWRISRWTPNRPLPTWSTILGESTVRVLPTHFNPNNSLLILLQISLLFVFTSALTPRTLNASPLVATPKNINFVGGSQQLVERRVNMVIRPWLAPCSLVCGNMKQKQAPSCARIECML